MIGVALLLLAASAQPAGEVKSMCADERTQAEINACAAREFAAADKAMNQAWKDASGFIKNDDAPAEYPSGNLKRDKPSALLLKAQRAWLAMRDTHCQLVGYAARGGSLEPFMVNICRARLTEQRTQELNDLMFEGE